MSTLRLWHSYLGVLIAPSVLFFSLTGAVQLFSLHEDHGDYHAPVLLERLASVHKDQVLTGHEHHGPSAGPPPQAAAVEPGGAPSQSGAEPRDQGPTAPTLLLKWFFLMVALGLATSTGLGLWIAFTRQRRPRLTWALLITGLVIPLLLLVSL